MDIGKDSVIKLKGYWGKFGLLFFNKINKNKSDYTIHFKNVSKNLFRYFIRCTDIKEWTSLCNIISMLDYLTK